MITCLRTRTGKQCAIFFLMTLLLSSWHLDQASNANSVSRAAMVAAIVEQGTFSIDRFALLTGDKAVVNGHAYSEKPPLPALLVVPFHWILSRTGAIAPSTSDHINADLLRLGGSLCGSLPFTIILLICWCRLQETNNGQKGWYVPVTFFGSFLFVYSGSFYGHLIGAMFILLALLNMDRNAPYWAGFFAGCAVLCEYALAIFPMCWILGTLIYTKWTSTTKYLPGRSLLNFILGGIPFAVLLMIYNVALFGNAFSLGYDHVAEYAPEGTSVIDHIHPEALWGLSFSAYRGLIPYMPLLGVGLLAWLATKPRWTALLDLRLTVPVIITFLFISSVGLWWGGWAFGPRHLTGVAVLLAYQLLPTMARTKWILPLLLIAGLWGLFFAFAAKHTVWYSLATGIMDPLQDVILPAIQAGRFSGYQWPVLLGLSPVASSILFITLFLVYLAYLVVSDRSTDHSHEPLLHP